MRARSVRKIMLDTEAGKSSEGVSARDFPLQTREKVSSMNSIRRDLLKFATIGGTGFDLRPEQAQLRTLMIERWLAIFPDDLALDEVG
jgi:hypothetical protein